MSLAITYCKEIISELKKIPVFLPGESVDIGDIISFNSSKSFFGKQQPVGPFERITSLSKLGVAFEKLSEDNNPQPYTFASKNKISIDLSAATATGDLHKESLTVHFKEAGATYFCAVGCSTQKMDDLPNVGLLLRKHENTLDWSDYFVVTSITKAQKALIMQSSSDSARLQLIGDVKAFQPTLGLTIQASANLTSVKSENSTFSKDWSDNVNVFFGLAQYKKKRFLRRRSFGNAKLSRDTFERLNELANEEYYANDLTNIEIDKIDLNSL